MGSCASIHKNSPGSAMKMVSFGSKSDKLVILESPRKESSTPAPVPAADGGRVIKPRWSFASINKSYGSKDENFYDSQPWLESDCDEDFYSVNGDFTPSRGNTPQHSFSGGIPGVNNPLFEGKPYSLIPNQPSSTKRKKLVELFKESIREQRQQQQHQGDTDGQENAADNLSETSKKSEAKAGSVVGIPVKSAHTTPYVSGTNSSACSSGRIANEDSVTEKQKPLRYSPRCLPGLVSCRSFSEKKKKTNPAIAVN